ncbi:hypothetical protein SDC9_103439 [bioreactor metagenome]|uniref:Uncharacterized protein n=1 Tax=bioreactor metagenome TaxID=1076179 RepID=A0A645AU38_9ZZZZ
MPARLPSRARQVPSVPSIPTAEVTPARTKEESWRGGVLLAGPPSPPAPLKWTCLSRIPGMVRFPPASTVLKSAERLDSAPGSAVPAEYTERMRPAAIRMSHSPLCSGSYRSAFRIRSMKWVLLSSVPPWRGKTNFFFLGQCTGRCREGQRSPGSRGSPGNRVDQAAFFLSDGQMAMPVKP